jgi:hypothetical protein
MYELCESNHQATIHMSTFCLKFQLVKTVTLSKYSTRLHRCHMDDGIEEVSSLFLEGLPKNSPVKILTNKKNTLVRCLIRSLSVCIKEEVHRCKAVSKISINKCARKKESKPAGAGNHFWQWKHWQPALVPMESLIRQP